MTPDELRALIKTTIEETLKVHVCTQFTEDEADTLRDVAAVGSGVKKGMIRAISAALVAGVIALFSLLGGWEWWKGP